MKDANGVKNLVNVLEVTGYNDLMIVVSAMGKTTNALEDVLKLYFQKGGNYNSALSDIESFHLAILDELFNNKGHNVYRQLKELMDELYGLLGRNKSPDYNFYHHAGVGVAPQRVAVILDEVGGGDNVAPSLST